MGGSQMWYWSVSKNILKRFNNMKNKMLLEILKRLWDSFFYNNDHVQQEILEDMVDNILQRQHNDDGDDDQMI